MNVGFYTGEYAAKKIEISRSMLPELYAGAGVLWSGDEAGDIHVIVLLSSAWDR